MKNSLNQRFWGMLSLSQKAGALSVGESRAQETIRSDKAELIILSADASENTKKKFSDMASYRDIPLITIADRDCIGSAIGIRFAVIIAVSDKGFADNLLRLYNNSVE